MGMLIKSNMEKPNSLSRDITPPRVVKRRKTTYGQVQGDTCKQANGPDIEPTLAAIEAGKAKIEQHVSYFKEHLRRASRPTPPECPRLHISEFASLYQANDNPHGHHFVVHQHNHPKAGVHYDLRLQFSQSSSISFAVPKGLPGNPNSRSNGRMAIETRVHNFWNHLIESASSKTGSLLIWDTGTYDVLPRRKEGIKRNLAPSPRTTDDDSDSSASAMLREKPCEAKYENEKLIAAFQSRYIRLRLRGSRLPENYTIILRLPSNEIIKHPTARRRGKQNNQAKRHEDVSTSTDGEDESDTKQPLPEPDEDLDTDTEEDTETRLYNAYPGSTNDIGSIHQRHWYLMLDRLHSGFLLSRSEARAQEWTRSPTGGGFEPFIVRGREYERSVVTGRLAREVESDEGVEGFVGRGGWVGIDH